MFITEVCLLTQIYCITIANFVWVNSLKGLWCFFSIGIHEVFNNTFI